MIRQVTLTILLLCIFLTGAVSAQNPMVCRLGFSYEVSLSPNWGKGKPVITSVYPYSSAEQTGLKSNDIIESIDGVTTGGLPAEDIAALLNPAGKNEIVLTVTNLEVLNKPLRVRKECKRKNTITEDQLASAFAMYSLETTSERLFICPFKTTVTTDSVDFLLFKTFAFTAIDEGNRKLEETINTSIRKVLEKKGLNYDPDNPDMLIQTFYFFDKNPNYGGRNVALVQREPTYRYNYTSSQMEKYPFLHFTAAEAEAEYLLQFGFRFVDQQYQKGRTIWECEANEMLEAAYRLESYAFLHVPLMCMQYPYVKYGRNVQYKVSRKMYNYTGISYDINRLNVVSDVDRNSVAYAAGIRVNDVIEKIDNHAMSYSADELTAAYKQFITNTMKYRNQETLFTDAYGFGRCMFWEKDRYVQVAAVLQDAKSMSPFSYLYKYAPYVDPSTVNVCTFHIRRGKNKMEMILRPPARTETVIMIK